MFLKKQPINTMNKITPKNFQKKILHWFDQHGRHDLPWQQDKTPYRVWVSEIMLQQTQVNTVIPYYQRFMERFPNIQTLADTTEDEVLHYWTGLGYYSRARNLYRTAKIIKEKYHGVFPEELILLEDLPGIGRSTAGAILAIALQKTAAILDGNVKRVLTRLHALQEWPGEKKIIEQLWILTEKYTPNQRIGDYTQAMMDLGATVCTRGKPHCEICPLTKNCLAHRYGIEKILPKTKPQKTLPIKKTTLLILQNKSFVLLHKRPSIGVWGGLWSFPEIKENVTQTEIQTRFSVEIKTVKMGALFRHTFSHFHLDIQPLFLTIKKTKHKIMANEQQIWYNLQQPIALGLPAPIKSLLEKLL